MTDQFMMQMIEAMRGGPRNPYRVRKIWGRWLGYMRRHAAANGGRG